MRNEPTPLERASGSALVEKLSQHYQIDRPVFGDRPDLTFTSDGFNVAVEITSLLPEDVHHAIKMFFRKLLKEGVNLGKLIIPREPDMWIKAAIERKWKSVQKYSNFRELDNLNLLVHRPGIMADVIDYDEEGFLRALNYGHALSTHGFLNVYYWSGKRVVAFVRPDGPVPPVEYDLSRGYPAWPLVSHMSSISKTRGLLEGKSISFNPPPEHTKVIKPMTPAFKGLKPHQPEGDIRFKFGFKDEDEILP